MIENKLEVIVRESGLEKTKSEIVLNEFSHYFSIAADWEKKAKAIVVTGPENTAEISGEAGGRARSQFLRVSELWF